MRLPPPPRYLPLLVVALTGDRFVERIAEERGVEMSSVAFVGDGRNDRFIAAAVGFSIAFNGAEELRRVTTAHVEQRRGEEDFLPVLDLLKGWFKSKGLA